MIVMHQLDRLEKLAQRLIEGPFYTLFRNRLYFSDLTHHLLRAMEHESRYVAGLTLAPNSYQIYLNPLDYRTLADKIGHAVLVAHLHNYLARLIEEANSQLHNPLRLALEIDHTVPRGQARVRARHEPALSREGEQTTKRRTSTKELLMPTAAAEALRWSLQTERQIIRLGQPVMTIGSASQNDIVLEQATIQPYHAQLRWRHRRYHLCQTNLTIIQPQNGNLDPENAKIAVNHVSVWQSQPLSHNDVLNLGQVDMTVIIKPVT